MGRVTASAVCGCAGGAWSRFNPILASIWNVRPAVTLVLGRAAA